MGRKNVYRQICCAFDLSSDLHNHVRLLANKSKNTVREKKYNICHCGIRGGVWIIACDSAGVGCGKKKRIYTYRHTHTYTHRYTHSHTHTHTLTYVHTYHVLSRVRHFLFWRLGLNNEHTRGAAVRMPIKGCYTKRLLGRRQHL